MSQVGRGGNLSYDGQVSPCRDKPLMTASNIRPGTGEISLPVMCCAKKHWLNGVASIGIKRHAISAIIGGDRMTLWLVGCKYTCSDIHFRSLDFL